MLITPSRCSSSKWTATRNRACVSWWPCAMNFNYESIRAMAPARLHARAELWLCALPERPTRAQPASGVGSEVVYKQRARFFFTNHRLWVVAGRDGCTVFSVHVASRGSPTQTRPQKLGRCEALSSHPQGPRRLREVTGGGAGMVPYELPPHGVVIGASMEKPCSSGCTDASPAFH